MVMKVTMKIFMVMMIVLSGVPYLVMWLVALGGSFTIDKLIGEIFADSCWSK